MDPTSATNAYAPTAGNTSSGLSGVVAYVITVINDLVWVLGSLALLMFLWGVLQYVIKPADKHKYKNMQWSMLALFVLFSIWGIIHAMCLSYQGICQ